MNRGTIFTRTDKGEQMAASDSRELANDLRKVLSAIDGTSSVEELQTRLNFRSADWLDRSVAALLARDLIREAEGSAGMLDFTSIAPAAPDEQQRKAAEQARKEAEQQAAKKQAEEQARRQAEEKARHEAAERARKEAEQQAAKKLAEEQARRQAEEKARHEAAERARKEAEQQAAKKLAEEQARKQAEDQELKQAAERVRLKAAEQAREEAEKQAKQAEEQELKQAAERVRQKAAERARQEAEEQARKLAEEQARKDAEEQERRKAAERAREEAEQQARKLAEEQTRREAAERARQEAEQQARKLAEELERRDGEEKARREAEEKARYEAEARIRREVEEKARHEAEETARRQAEERTRRDAEEKTRHAAEEKARYEAEEKVRREAGEKARHEAERARQEAEAQAQRTADDAGRHEAEEAARREAERVRQEAAANDRMAAEEKAWREAEDKFRREEQEAAAKRDKRATAKEAKSGSAKPSNRARQLAAGITALLVIGVVAVHLVSFDGQIPQFEKSLAAQFQQPVKIKSLRLSLVPQRHVRLEGVSIGNEGQISIPEIKAIGALGNLVNDRKAFSAVELNSPVVTEEGLGWILFGEAQAQGVAFGPVTVLNAKLQSKNVSLPAFDAKLQPDGQGDWKTIVMESTDKNLSLELTPKDQSVQIDLKARTFKLPFGSTLVLDELVASATANKAGLAVTEFKAFAYGGILSGNAGLKWGAQWSLSGELNAKQVDASRLFPGIVDDGRLVGTAAYAMQAADAGKLFATKHLEGDFKVARGNLLGVDFGRMIQGGATSGTTKFAELSGAFVHDRGATQLRQMRLHEGAMAASGTAEVDATDNVRGRLAIELRMASELRRASLAVGGTLQKIEWRRQ